jgi:hypothetical protein
MESYPLEHLLLAALHLLPQKLCEAAANAEMSDNAKRLLVFYISYAQCKCKSA